MKKTVSKKAKQKITTHTCNFPLAIIKGDLFKPRGQVENCLTNLFDFIEESGEVALKANIQITVFTREK